MTPRAARLVRLLAMLLAPAPARALAQTAPSGPTVFVSAGGGLLASSAYFTGPGGLQLDNSNAFAGMLQVMVPLHRSLGIVVAGTYARPEWRLTGVPVFGSVGLDGASLWFADASLRGQVPLAQKSSRGPTAFAQVGPGLAHYGLSTSLLGRAIDESATNFALALGGGIDIPVTERVGIELIAKDYVVSFRSVRDLETLGIEGRRAHTLVLGVSGRVGL